MRKPVSKKLHDLAMAMELFIVEQELRGPPNSFSFSPSLFRTHCRGLQMRIISKLGIPRSRACESMCQCKQKRDLNIPFPERYFAEPELSTLPGSSMACIRDQQIGGERNGGKWGDRVMWGLLLPLKLNCTGGWFWREVGFGEVQVTGWTRVKKDVDICWF